MAIKIAPDQARRFMRRALLLDLPVETVGAAVAHLGYLQIDPINICGRMHDLVARLRVRGYREGDLMRHLHGEGAPHSPEQRIAFEHHLPSTGILVAFSLDAWPHLLAAMEARTRRAGAWSGRLSRRERELAERLLAEIAARGPLGSDAIEDSRRAHRRGWGASTLAKATLQKLFFHGRLLIARRENGRRQYDLPERVLPAATLALPRPGPEDTSRWLALAKLRQRRLVTLKRNELPLVEDRVEAVAVEGCAPLYCLREDLPLFDAVAAEAAAGFGPPTFAPRLLAPLDPLVYDRAVTSRLWNFDYTWEAYTPAHRRLRGYYALPILAGTELVGHVDPKADRVHRKLHVISRRVRRGFRVAPAIDDLAAFLGLKR